MLKPQPEIPIEVDGQNVGLRYYTLDPFNTPSHTFTILFAHGIRATALYFQPLAECLAQYGCRSIALEYPGYDQEKWGTSSVLEPFTIPVFARYVHQALKILSSKYTIGFENWIIWGHSMGGAVTYNAVKQYPMTFDKMGYIVLEAPAFERHLTFGTKAAIHLSRLIRNSRLGHMIGRYVTQTYYTKRELPSGPSNHQRFSIEGHCDSYRVLDANTTSIRHPANNFDAATFESVGLNKLIWVWSPDDVVLHAQPPDIIPQNQQIQLKTAHGISSAAPKLVCDAFLSRSRSQKTISLNEVL